VTAAQLPIRRLRRFPARVQDFLKKTLTSSTGFGDRFDLGEIIATESAQSIARDVSARFAYAVLIFQIFAILAAGRIGSQQSLHICDGSLC
jgi:hypothetical protein